MAIPKTCAVCGGPRTSDAASCPACNARAAPPPLPRTRRGVSRPWRQAYGAGDSAGATVGLVAILLMLWAFVGPLVMAAALAVLGVVALVRRLVRSRAVAPSVAERRATQARHARVRRRLGARPPAHPAVPGGRDGDAPDAERGAPKD